MGLLGSVGSTVGEEALQGGTVGEGSPRRGGVGCWWWGNICPALDVWDDDWLSLGIPKAMTVVADGMALEGGRGLQMYSAMLVQCLAELFPKISDLRLGDLLYSGL